VAALELLKTGAATYGTVLLDGLRVHNPVDALGFGWLLAYVFLSGSPVAVVALSFFAAGTINELQTFMMITGSRLGAALVILLISIVYYLRGHRRDDSLSVGVLTVLLTAAIYLPAALIGYWFLARGYLANLPVPETRLPAVIDTLFAPVTTFAGRYLPGWGIMLCGALILIVALNTFEQAMPQYSDQHVERWISRRYTYMPLLMFLIGALITALTFSVSVSIAILVPLTIRGGLRREALVPYIMGANITTFVDTLFAALIVGGTAAFNIVLVEMLSVAFLSFLVLLLLYQQFLIGILWCQKRITASNRSLLLFLLVLLILPLVILMIA
jgi:solute carrier family 34 (sodium-dependent phosphate cotransporter)